MGWGGHVRVPATSYVICCYAAEISGVVAALYVATLQRSLVLHCVHEGVGRGGVGGGIVSNSWFPTQSFQITCLSFRIIVSESAVLSFRI